MTDTVDVRHADELLLRLEPELDYQERALRAITPALGDDELREAALRTALARLGADVSRRTFVYLRWKVEQARRSGWTVPEASTRPPSVREAGRALAAAEAAALRVPRLMCDHAGDRWIVSEVGTPAPHGGAGTRALVFAKARERRRLSVYPRDWRSLSNDALGALLPPG